MWLIFLLNSSFIITFFVFFFKQAPAYKMRISDWSSDVCSSDRAACRICVATPSCGSPASADESVRGLLHISAHRAGHGIGRNELILQASQSPQKTGIGSGAAA